MLLANVPVIPYSIEPSFQTMVEPVIVNVSPSLLLPACANTADEPVWVITPPDHQGTSE
jgi:hypothetical protein